VNKMARDFVWFSNGEDMMSDCEAKSSFEDVLDSRSFAISAHCYNFTYKPYFEWDKEPNGDPIAESKAGGS